MLCRLQHLHRGMKVKYLLIKKYTDGSIDLSTLNDPIAAFKTGKYNPDKDELYVLGNRVKVSVVVMPVLEVNTYKFRENAE
jgi:hypothetical protein